MALENDPPDLADRLRIHLATLHRPGLGRRLVEAFGGAAGVLARSAGELRGFPGMVPEVLRKLSDRSIASSAREEIRRAGDSGVRILAAGESSYPPALRELPDMPLVLYLRGSLPEAPAVGIVGSRRPTRYASVQARTFSAGLARRGFAIVSGLALGVDGEAHRACLDAGGRTVAVLGSGMDRIYPPEHRALARRILESGDGALVGELPFGAPPLGFHFPMRNRILSGLSDAVLVVEAGARSGSLVTARHALEQGKAVYAVPGRISPEALGGLRLIADGAIPALSPEDVLPGAGRTPGAPGEGRDPGVEVPTGGGTGRLDGPYARALEDLFREEDLWTADAIADRLGAPPGRILAELSRLELDGRIERLPGGAYALRGGVP
ncbi:MAG: DNA-processing protein DprA [Planctomycetota bacterium]